MRPDAVSAVIDTIEHMFDSGSVSAAAARIEPDRVDPDRPSPDRLSTVAALRERIRGMERRSLREESGLAARRIPTHPVIAPLLPGGGMRAGAVYAVGPSAALTAALLAEPSRAGLWAAVVGIPEFGVEAAVEAGVRLDRLVLVPRPGEQWVAAVGVLAEVMGVIVVRVPRGVAAGAVDRLGARLRRHGCTLLATGPSAAVLGGEALVAVEASRWHGIGRGHGVLAERELEVRATSAGGASRTGLLRISDQDEAQDAHETRPAPLPRLEAAG